MVENKKSGRPLLFGERLIQRAAYLRPEQIGYLDSQGINFSEFSRDMIDRLMRGEIAYGSG